MKFTISQIKRELQKNNVPYSNDETYEDLEEKLYSLAITEGQIKALADYGISYKQSWSWNRRAAYEFLKDIIEYNEILKKLPVTPYQKIVLIQHGIFDFENMTSGEAAEIIYNLPPTEEQLNRINTFMIEIADRDKLTYGYAESLIQNYTRKIFG